MDTVRWGLLSTANINKALIPPIRASKRGRLVAVASRSQATADAYARRWEIPQAFGSYEAMLASDKVDAVYISLPNHLHAEWSIRALQAGKHVLCEKPFAISLAEVDAMVAASRSTGYVLAEAFMYRHHPQTKLAGEWARSGRLGDICMIRGVFNFALSEARRKPEDLDVRLVAEYGGGCLWDVGVYPVSFAQFVMGGPPESVAGFQWVGKTGVDETFAGVMHYSGNRLAQAASAFRSPFHSQIEIIGTLGRIVLSKPFVGLDRGRKMTFIPDSGEPEELKVPRKELYLGEVEDMHAAILDGASPYISLEESRNHVRTILALYESARTGQVVHL
jgi:xylose dehydrogenase (NAD/NADP)